MAFYKSSKEKICLKFIGQLKQLTHVRIFSFSPGGELWHFYHVLPPIFTALDNNLGGSNMDMVFK
jgi:hypothetical protein